MIRGGTGMNETQIKAMYNQLQRIAPVIGNLDNLYQTDPNNTEAIASAKAAIDAMVYIGGNKNNGVLPVFNFPMTKAGIKKTGLDYTIFFIGNTHRIIEDLAEDGKIKNYEFDAKKFLTDPMFITIISRALQIGNRIGRNKNDIELIQNAVNGEYGKFFKNKLCNEKTSTPARTFIEANYAATTDNIDDRSLLLLYIKLVSKETEIKAGFKKLLPYAKRNDYKAPEYFNYDAILEKTEKALIERKVIPVPNIHSFMYRFKESQKLIAQKQTQKKGRAD